MGVRLSIEIISPLEPDDRDMLTGLSVMVMAIANHELAKARFPETFTDEELAQQQQAMPCGSLDADGFVCVSDAGHKGRHKYRPLVKSIDLN